MERLYFFDGSEESYFSYMDKSEFLRKSLEKKELSDMIEIIVGSEENLEIFINYFLYLNIYLSKTFYVYTGNFLDENWKIDLEESEGWNYFKSQIFEKLEDTDFLFLNIERLEDHDFDQKVLFSRLIQSIVNFENFWKSLLDEPVNNGWMDIHQLMDSMWLWISMWKEKEFKTFVQYELAVYAQKLLDVLNDED